MHSLNKLKISARTVDGIEGLKGLMGYDIGRESEHVLGLLSKE